MEPVDLSSKTVLFHDYGLFTALAETLAHSFGTTYYYSPWKSDIPEKWRKQIGLGLPGVTRVDDFFFFVDKADLIVFPDIYDGDLQIYLEDRGKRVWGSRQGDLLERFRVSAKQHMKEKGLTIGPYDVVIGCDALRDYLRHHPNVWVKCSDTRGLFETFFAPTYRVVETKIDQIAYELGPDKDDEEFVCEQAIEDAVEVGWDGYCIDGQYPSACTIGIEAKNEAYVGKFLPRSRWPNQIADINEKMADTLEEAGYRNAFCIEHRLTKDGKAYILDPCCRFGSPPNELLQMMYKNIAEIIWYGAEGICVDSEPAGKYGVQIMLHAEDAKDRWLPVYFPPEIREHVKLQKARRKAGVDYVRGTKQVGAVVAVGDSLDDVIDEVQELVKQVKVCESTCGDKCVDGIKDDFRKLREYGITL